MTKKDTRDLIGYGSNLPKVEWPNKARIAVQIVLNYEEGQKIVFLMETKIQKFFCQKL